MRAPSASRAGLTHPARFAFQNAKSQGLRRFSVVGRAESSNPFQKIGTQLQKAGSQLTERLSGTAKVARRGAVNDDVVFIAGATGRLGSRIVKQALLAGYRVRAGVRTAEKGEQLVEQIDEVDGLSPNERRLITCVEFDLLDKDSIASAIGNAGMHSPARCVQSDSSATLSASVWHATCRRLQCWMSELGVQLYHRL
jgi:NAD(P)H-binding